MNLPLTLPGKPALAGGSVLDFHDRLGSQPRLAFCLRETPESMQASHQAVTR
ncbi:hypothetical protein [Janthinobacterium sp. LB3P112]|uniref:hypothetical protein n=1 Tax=Janthinobacterium sp. LB3P112 TaxID=3424196 RepID=UPI003F1E55CD